MNIWIRSGRMFRDNALRQHDTLIVAHPDRIASDRPIRVMALGLRSISGVAGGIETHCENLYRQMLEAGIGVDLIVRRHAGDAPTPAYWHGARVRGIWAVRKPGLENALHSFLGVVFAAFSRPDVLHLHGVGPALLTPVARLFGLPVVVTHHGADYEREKWGIAAKWLLRAGERMAMRYANEVISVSRQQADVMRTRYGRLPVAIPNGVPAMLPTSSVDILETLGLVAGRYILHVGRAAPEKRQNDLIEAFVRAHPPGWKLVLAGNLSGNDRYSARVRALAAAHSTVVLAGFQTGQALQALFANAGCFALPSTIEGMSIALLEALRFGCPTVASDIPANHEVELPEGTYFKPGDVDALATALATIPRTIPRETWNRLADHVRTEYDWSRIAEKTIGVYRKVLDGET